MGHWIERDERDLEGGYRLLGGRNLFCHDNWDHLLASRGSAQQELDFEGEFQRTYMGETDANSGHSDADRGQNVRRD